MYINPSALPALGFTGVGLYGHFNLDWTVHVWDSDLERGISSLKFRQYGGTNTVRRRDLFTKLSTLSLTYRLTRATSSRMRYFALAVGVVTALDTLTFILVTIFSCSPVSDFWTLSFAPQKCVDERAHLVSGSIVNTFTDFLIVLLPAPLRLIVALLFGGGFLASVAGAVRTYFTYVFVSSPSVDLTWNAYYVTLTGAIELNVGIISMRLGACHQAILWPLFPWLVHSGSHPAETAEPNPGISAKSLTVFIINDTDSEMYLVPRPAYAVAVAAPNLNKPLPKPPIPLAELDRGTSWYKQASPVQSLTPGAVDEHMTRPRPSRGVPSAWLDV
ncbi:hypothetical protein GQ53DRAFT_766969 [Thozetella sp. PMI_491]|nr:hypothetical protein GQ53DRAFT_766969 [Thozetella sp. PMI_491]